MTTSISLIKDITNLYDFEKYLKTNYSYTQGLLYEELTHYLEITFTQDITSDLSTIYSLISSYQNVSIPVNTYNTILSTNVIGTTVTSYTTYYTFIYKGKSFGNILSSITMLSYLQPNLIDDSNLSTFNYSIQVLDVTNNVTLGSLTGLTNNTLQKQVITLTDVSESESWIQIQLKKDVSGSGLFIDYVEANYTD